MTIETENRELIDRLSLIEGMIAEGRQKTESWGWTFVLWGAAYSAAILFANLGAPLASWSIFGHRSLAWPVCMVGAMILMFAYISIHSRKAVKEPDTTMGRAIFSIWIAMGISMTLLLAAAGAGARLDQQLFVAIVSAMLGATNAASSMILKWRVQGLCAAVWWMACVASCFVNTGLSLVFFLAAIFLCQIVFGAYGMISEQKQMARKSGALNA